MFVKFVGIIFTYLGSSIGIFLLLSRLLQVDKKKILSIFFLTIGLGPITISFLLKTLFYFFPKKSDFFYISLIIIIFLSLYLFNYKQCLLLKQLFNQTINTLKKWTYTQLIPLLIVIIITIMLFLQCILLPIHANDPLKYATMSRYIYKYKALDIYPFYQPTPEIGIYAPSTHPLGYHMLIVWSYMLQGNSEYAGLIKIISPFYVFYTLLLLGYILSDRGNIYGILSMFLLITTPLYYTQSSVCHIDPLRVYTFFLAFVCLSELIQNNYRKWFLVFSGYVVGISMYSHSIGILTLPFFVFIYFIVSKEKFTKNIVKLIIISIVALLIGGHRYIYNYKLYGYFVGDKLKVMQIKDLHYDEYFRTTRQLITTFDRVIFGALVGFSNLKQFGITYWLFLLSILFYRKKLIIDKQMLIFFYVVLLFYTGVFLSLLFNMDIFIKNPRYFLTVHPFVVCIGGLLVGYLYEKAITS